MNLHLYIYIYYIYIYIYIFAYLYIYRDDLIARLIPAGQNCAVWSLMSYKLSGHVFWRIPGGSVESPREVSWEVWRVLRGPWRFLKVPGRFLVGPWRVLGGHWGVPGGSVGVPLASLGGSEAPLGVAVAGTNRFVIYTICFTNVLVINLSYNSHWHATIQGAKASLADIVNGI